MSNSSKVTYTFENIYADKLSDEEYAKLIELEYIALIRLRNIASQLAFLLFAINPYDLDKSITDILKVARDMLKNFMKDALNENEKEKPISCSPLEGEKGKILCLIDGDVARVLSPKSLEVSHIFGELILDFADFIQNIFSKVKNDEKKEGAM